MVAWVIGSWLVACGVRPVPRAELDPDDVPAAALDPAQQERRRQAFMTELRGFVEELEGQGRYDCCVKIPCSHCALMAGGCACGEGLRRGEPVCEECAYLWTKGQGAEAVDPSEVRSFLEASKGECACPAHEAPSSVPQGG